MLTTTSSRSAVNRVFLYRSDDDDDEVDDITVDDILSFTKGALNIDIQYQFSMV